METNTSAPDRSSGTTCGTSDQHLSDAAIAGLARVPDHRLTLAYIFTEFGVTKRQLLRSYVTCEIENALEPTGTLCQWIERTFPEDIRTAIINEGQMRAIEGYDRLAGEIRELNGNIRELISQLQIVTKHK